MLDARTFDPVEARRAEQDEVNQQRQNKQEGKQSDENTPWIKKKPNSPHNRSPLDQIAADHVTGQLPAMRDFRIALYVRQPGPPVPNQNVGDDRNDGETNEASHKYPMELFGLSFRQARQTTCTDVSFYHNYPPVSPLLSR
jgi:hypothetical protein